MGIFDDIFDSIDDITKSDEPQKSDDGKKLTVSEAESKTGVWNAQDDGNVWTADNGPIPWTTGQSNSNRKAQGMVVKDCGCGDDEDCDCLDEYKCPGISRSSDDRMREDEVLNDFVDEEDDFVDIFSKWFTRE